MSRFSSFTSVSSSVSSSSVSKKLLRAREDEEHNNELTSAEYAALAISVGANLGAFTWELGSVGAATVSRFPVEKTFSTWMRKTSSQMDKWAGRWGVVGGVFEAGNAVQQGKMSGLQQFEGSLVAGAAISQGLRLGGVGARLHPAAGFALGVGGAVAGSFGFDVMDVSVLQAIPSWNISQALAHATPETRRAIVGSPEAIAPFLSVEKVGASLINNNIEARAFAAYLQATTGMKDSRVPFNWVAKNGNRQEIREIFFPDLVAPYLDRLVVHNEKMQAALNQIDQEWFKGALKGSAVAEQLNLNGDNYLELAEVNQFLADYYEVFFDGVWRFGEAVAEDGFGPEKLQVMLASAVAGSPLHLQLLLGQGIDFADLTKERDVFNTPDDLQGRRYAAFADVEAKLTAYPQLAFNPRTPQAFEEIWPWLDQKKLFFFKRELSENLVAYINANPNVITLHPDDYVRAVKVGLVDAVVHHQKQGERLAMAIEQFDAHIPARAGGNAREVKAFAQQQPVAEVVPLMEKSAAALTKDSAPLVASIARFNNLHEPSGERPMVSHERIGAVLQQRKTQMNAQMAALVPHDIAVAMRGIVMQDMATKDMLLGEHVKGLTDRRPVTAKVSAANG